MDMAKVTSKGQITIPVSIRKRLGINEGDKLLFIDRPDGVMMVNPDMFPSEHSETESARSYDEPPVIYKAEVSSSVRDAQAQPQKRPAVQPSVQPSGQPSKPAPNEVFNVSAMLEEIRSIGSKI